MTDPKKLAQQWDAQDPLKHFRERFYHPDDTIYLDGNSLGKLPLGVTEIVTETIHQQWGNQLIRSWNDHWLNLPEKLAQQLGQLLGGGPNEIILGESTSVRLYQIAQALALSKDFPNRLFTDVLNFPTDQYILEGIARHYFSSSLQVVSYPRDKQADIALLMEQMAKHPGIYCLSLVTYKSGFLYPMKTLNQHAKQHNCIIIWDVSHAVGVVAIDFKATETLVALGCSYKYLNGGPGAPAFLYVSESIIDGLDNPIAGWFGHASPFAFSQQYQAAQGIQKMAIGTPQILSLAALEKGIAITLEAGTAALQQKSRRQTQFLYEEIEKHLSKFGVVLESPSSPEHRGAHVSISHSESWRINLALQAGKPKIIPDYRPDRFLRLGLAPLYTTFEDLQKTVETLETILGEQTYLRFSHQMPEVT